MKSRRPFAAMRVYIVSTFGEFLRLATVLQSDEHVLLIVKSLFTMIDWPAVTLL